MPIHVTTSTVQSLSNKTFVDRVSTTGVVYANGSNSDQWNNTFTSYSAQSGNNASVYSTVQQNSGTYATKTYTHSNFFPTTGGFVSGESTFTNNVTIFGNLSCSGTQTFANTVFTTTSSLSVVHFGSGPAIWVGNNGNGDIASFYDIDQNVEVLHVGGINSTFPNVGVKISNPNKALTVSGEISSTSVIYDATGNSTDWNNTFTNVNANSADWESVYSTVQANSANAFSKASIGITLDGAGSAITTGTKGTVSVPYNAIINSATITADQVGSIVIDVKKATFAGYPTTTSICAAAKPTLTSAQKSTDSTLTGWTTTVNSGDILEFVVDSASTVTKVTLVLGVTKFT